MNPAMDLSLASAVLFGLAPALQSTRTDLVPALKTGDQACVGKQRTIGRNALVIAQVALSMAILVAAGMLVDGARKTVALDPGFRTDHRLMTKPGTLPSFGEARDFCHQNRSASPVFHGNSTDPGEEDAVVSYQLVEPLGHGRKPRPLLVKSQQPRVFRVRRLRT